MHLTALKNLTTIENKYYSLKMAAFIRVANYKAHFYEARTKLDYSSCETPESNSVLYQPVLVNETSPSYKLINKMPIIPL
jgi:hypothetical protein